MLNWKSSTRSLEQCGEGLGLHDPNVVRTAIVPTVRVSYAPPPRSWMMSNPKMSAVDGG